MKPAPFHYHRPESLAEAISILTKLGEGAQVLAGGQSLVPMMSLRLSRPEHVVDINRIAELSRLEREDGWLCIGALTRHEVLERSALAYEACPLLSKAASFIGDRQIRARGTIGGSLALCYPGAEWPTAILAVGAQIVVAGVQGKRTIPVDEFFYDMMSTAIRPGEILTEIHVPVFGPEVHWAFEEYPFKPSGLAIASTALTLRMYASGRCRAALLVIGGAGPSPVRILQAEAAIEGEPLSDELIDHVADIAFQAIDPNGDFHASGEYRRAIARNCVHRALKTVKGS
jgi:carbon-monoxide dehydrogenase medium subunit